MHIVIAGGGVIGAAIAWRAAAAGAIVTVVDPAPGRATSWAAAGMLAPVTEAHFGEEPLLQLNLAAARLWPAFAGALAEAAGTDPGYRTCGTFTVARDLDDTAALAELFGFQQRLGLAVEKLTASQLRARQPALSPRIRGGLFAAADHQVDNRALVRALLTAARRAGAAFDDGSVAAVSVDGHRATGVQLGDGRRLGADAVVLAAGVATPRIGGVPAGILPPVRPVKGQLLHLRERDGSSLPTAVLRGLDVYVVSRGDGRLVVGATVEERGEDRAVTAGAVLDLLRAAWELLPGIAEMELVETVVGLRPATPDNAPALGPTRIDGLHVATGHYRNGILLAPITADAVTAGVLGNPPAEIAPFAPDRFARAPVTP